MKIKSKNTSKLKVLCITLAVLIALGAAAFYFLVLQKSESSPDSSLSDKYNSTQLAENPKNKTISPNTDRATGTTDPNTGKQTVAMVVSANTSDGKVYIRGGTNTPVPDSGVCFATLKGPSGETVRKDTTLLQNPSTTDCKTIIINSNELGSGEWRVSLNYASTDTEGSSNEVTFEII